MAALLNNKIHMRWGQLGVATIAPSCKIVAYVVTCIHPPFPVLPVIFVLAGFGNGLEDGGWNAWIGNMQNANELLGFLHGAYGLGATISPLIATSMVTKGNLPWYNFYYLMVRSDPFCSMPLLFIAYPSESFFVKLSHLTRLSWAWQSSNSSSASSHFDTPPAPSTVPKTPSRKTNPGSLAPGRLSKIPSPGSALSSSSATLASKSLSEVGWSPLCSEFVTAATSSRVLSSPASGWVSRLDVSSWAL